MSYVIGPRYSSDLMLLWLWCRLEAVVPIGPLAWEPPYAADAALKKKKKKKKKGGEDPGRSHVNMGAGFSDAPTS